MTLVPKTEMRKFQLKSEKGIFVGYCADTKGYRVQDPVNDRLNVSRDVLVLQEGVVLQEQPTEKVDFFPVL